MPGHPEPTELTAISAAALPLVEATPPGQLHAFEATDPRLGVGRAVTLLDLPADRGIVDVTEYLDRHADRPRRRAGTSTHESLASLAAHARAYRESRSVAFVSPEGKRITVVYDYDDAASSCGMAHWRGHRAEFNVALHSDFGRWLAAAGTPLTGGEFAELLEAGALQLVPPPPGPGGEGDARWAATRRELAARLHVNWGAPEEIIGLARTFKVKATADIVEARTLASGEAEVAFKETHTGEGGEKVRVPGLFLIATPVFEGDAEAYRIAVKLRYRLVAGGGVRWIYELHDIANLERYAWADLARRFRAEVEATATTATVDPETGEAAAPDLPPEFPVFIGRPEAPR